MGGGVDEICRSVGGPVHVATPQVAVDSRGWLRGTRYLVQTIEQRVDVTSIAGVNGTGVDGRTQIGQDASLSPHLRPRFTWERPRATGQRQRRDVSVNAVVGT